MGPPPLCGLVQGGLLALGVLGGLPPPQRCLLSHHGRLAHMGSCIPQDLGKGGPGTHGPWGVGGLLLAPNKGPGASGLGVPCWGWSGGEGVTETPLLPCCVTVSPCPHVSLCPVPVSLCSCPHAHVHVSLCVCCVSKSPSLVNPPSVSLCPEPQPRDSRYCPYSHVAMSSCSMFLTPCPCVCVPKYTYPLVPCVPAPISPPYLLGPYLLCPQHVVLAPASPVALPWLWLSPCLSFPIHRPAPEPTFPVAPPPRSRWGHTRISDPKDAAILVFIAVRPPAQACHEKHLLYCPRYSAVRPFPGRSGGSLSLLACSPPPQIPHDGTPQNGLYNYGHRTPRRKERSWVGASGAVGWARGWRCPQALCPQRGCAQPHRPTLGS